MSEYTTSRSIDRAPFPNGPASEYECRWWAEEEAEEGGERGGAETARKKNANQVRGKGSCNRLQNVARTGMPFANLTCRGQTSRGIELWTTGETSGAPAAAKESGCGVGDRTGGAHYLIKLPVYNEGIERQAGHHSDSLAARGHRANCLVSTRCFPLV